MGSKNPYRYRGYRYDTETGLYYLQSRYYSPEWGRFINADGMIGQTGELLSHNMFAYCNNNPVNKFDPAGFMALDCDGEGRTAVHYNPSKTGGLAKSISKSSGNSGVSTASTVAGFVSSGASVAAKITVHTEIPKGMWLAGLPISSTLGEYRNTGMALRGFSGATIGLSAYSNVKTYGYTSGAAGRTGIDVLCFGGLIVLDIVFPEMGLPLTLALTTGATGLDYG